MAWMGPLSMVTEGTGNLHHGGFVMIPAAHTSLTAVYGERVNGKLRETLFLRNSWATKGSQEINHELARTVRL